MPAAWLRLALIPAWIVCPPALAAGFSVGSQLREVRSFTTESSTGYECLDSGGGPPLPACPVDLGTTSDSDLQAAPDTAPFTATASTAGGSASQDSSLGITRIESTSSASATGSALESSPGPPYLIVIDIVAGEAEDRFTTSFQLDEDSAFELHMSGEIAYPDPSFPLSWDASLLISLVGPGGEIASLAAVPDPGCTPDASFQCTVAPTPVDLTGVLPAGSYTIAASVSSSASGSWLPSTGALSSAAAGSYALELRLVPGAELPALGPAGLAALGACLVGVGARIAARRRQA